MPRPPKKDIQNVQFLAAVVGNEGQPDAYSYDDGEVVAFDMSNPDEYARASRWLRRNKAVLTDRAVGKYKQVLVAEPADAGLEEKATAAVEAANQAAKEAEELLAVADKAAEGDKEAADKAAAEAVERAKAAEAVAAEAVAAFEAAK